MKKSNVLLIVVLAMLGASMAFGAGEFDNVDKVVGNLDKSVSTNSGLFMKNVMGWLPLITMAGGLFMGYRHAKKKGDQEEDSNKIALTVGIAGIGGVVVGVLIDALIGAGFMQDSTKGLQVLKNYWITALGL
ncbi:TPA: hypothetical protein RQJ16_001746 [Campylobacter fetus subsp. venerealis]|nr:hypothetical protein [Campylobacter fetus subsp. venerealis]HDX6311474.1 hypothetical protein [Campylobacter fetus subsp. venerealis]HDX6321098.1 hypothetical protein [Campylobacter fetus subsp. venerealis]HDX6323081.1 hypothetical protein [Campylobacter fetus subsp. venerealis]HDX8135899.1 hypothetical protein [Campylobacter fetus subsp. venerealis]